MKLFILLITALLFIQCNREKSYIQHITSPDKNIKLYVFVNDGRPGYLIRFNNEIIIDSSYVSFDFQNMPSLGDQLEIVETIENYFSEDWEMPWGEQRVVHNEYNQLQIQFREKTTLSRSFSIIFKLYNDGLGFRYSFPEQENMTDVVIMDENTEFNVSLWDG